MTTQYTVRCADLMFEVTRRCNMACAHCLRGKAQNLNMKNAIIDTVLDQVSSISTMIFTGGEPTLNVPAIQHTLDIIKAKNVSCNSFWLATNGKKFSPELVLTLLDFYAHCCADYGTDDFMGGLALSIDQFHDDIPEENILRYKALAFYGDDKERDIPSAVIVDDGLATENGLGVRERGADDNRLDIEIDHNEIDVNGVLYINAKGDVLGCCDFSYKKQNQYKYGNVLEESLADILLRVYREQKGSEEDEEFAA